MSADAAGRTRAAPHSRTRRGLWVRYGVLAAALVVAGLVLLLGARPSSLDRLESDLVAGEVTAVEVRGRVLSAESDGFATQQVRWRSGVLACTTEVLVVPPGSTRTVPSGAAVPDGGEVVVGDVVPRLRASAPDLVVDRGAYTGSGGSAYGLSLPGWLVLSTLGVWVVALLHVVNGPRPWRLTRWGWAWLVLLTAPLGVVLHSVLSGPTAGVPRPRRRHRVGGFAGFGLAVLLGVLLPGLAGS